VTGRSAHGRGFAQRIVAWQRESGRRDLPWLGDTDPYRVWVSEIMLQQTQVATVRAYYARFVRAFPDVASLARAPLDDVLALWSGLGYYSRARNLHRCAQAVMRDHGGAFPVRSDELALLPGIGRSTAAAIAAFCHGERAAVLDGNVRRVLARHLGFDGDLGRSGAQRLLWQQAQALLPRRDIAAYTQGLMDLGATLCLARRPQCALCPVRRSCAAHRQGRVDELPVKPSRARRGTRGNALLWLRHRGEVLLVRRPEQGVWAGLWSLPEFDDLDALNAVVADWPGRGAALVPIDHVLTHFDWRLTPLRWDLPARLVAAQRSRVEAAVPGGRWVGHAEALAMSLPAPVRKLLG
jgi:A/G-specific adenine glycosylase